MSQDLSHSYVDLQVNGYVGVDFNEPTTTLAEFERAALAMQADGVSIALPTIITASTAAMVRCIQNICQAREVYPTVASVFRGIHIEGPFLSSEAGFIGAHPVWHALAQDLNQLDALCAAGNGLIRLLTLAPEVDIGGRMTQFCRDRGILVSAGHTNANLDQLDACIEAGLDLFTHLGNGCPRLMDRHDNIIYRALSRWEKLRFTLIADGFHIPQLLFRNLLHWLPMERIAVVSDAISAAGLGPGTFQLGERFVTVGADRAARDPSGEHFVGSASTMRDADRWLSESLRLSLVQREQLLSGNAAAWLT